MQRCYMCTNFLVDRSTNLYLNIISNRHVVWNGTNILFVNHVLMCFYSVSNSSFVDIKSVTEVLISRFEPLNSLDTFKYPIFYYIWNFRSLE